VKNRITPEKIKELKDLLEQIPSPLPLDIDFIVSACNSIPSFIAEIEALKMKLDILANAAAERACPANGFIVCDKFVNAKYQCPEAHNIAYRKECWLQTVKEFADKKREATNETN